MSHLRIIAPPFLFLELTALQLHVNFYGSSCENSNSVTGWKNLMILYSSVDKVETMWHIRMVGPHYLLSELYPFDFGKATGEITLVK